MIVQLPCIKNDVENQGNQEENKAYGNENILF
jgi:hypothetical protein